MDKDIKLELEKQKTDRIDIVRKELAWEAEKQRIALEKLRKRYVWQCGLQYSVYQCRNLQLCYNILNLGH